MVASDLRAKIAEDECVVGMVVGRREEVFELVEVEACVRPPP